MTHIKMLIWCHSKLHFNIWEGWCCSFCFIITPVWQNSANNVVNIIQSDNWQASVSLEIVHVSDGKDLKCSLHSGTQHSQNKDASSAKEAFSIEAQMELRKCTLSRYICERHNNVWIIYSYSRWLINTLTRPTPIRLQQHFLYPINKLSSSKFRVILILLDTFDSR